MRKWTIISAGLVATAILIIAGCSAEQKPQQQAPAAATQKADSATSVAAATKTTAEYPIDWCVVSGEKLGEMGPPVTYTYQGRTIKFCCKMCIRQFEQNPARYLARLDSAAAGLIHAPSHEPSGQGS